MSSLTDLIETIDDNPEESVEDILSSAQKFLFPEDVRNLHGEHGTTIVYKSHQFGNISILTADPDGEDERKLFSHYLWNAGILMAERISGNRMLSDQETIDWSVENQTVLEVGAGTTARKYNLSWFADRRGRCWTCRDHCNFSKRS